MGYQDMTTQLLTIHVAANEIAPAAESPQIAVAGMLPTPATAQLMRMFRDPYVLEKEERVELIAQLREAISLEPAIPELRVLLGMTLCVNLEVQDALEELREATKLAPHNFLARLKFGELLMRLRICTQAAEETRAAEKLALNPIHAELARRQAAAIRTMQREGIERGGYGKLLSGFDRLSRLFMRTQPTPTPVALDPR
jgi:cytochrome c-type biogenesis protein CcmH/NrfG